jgi:predicted Zn-dependent peptidase
MEFRSHHLPNGLTVLAECNSQSHSAAFGIFVRTGARDETPEIGGVSHFLEHMVFKGTPRRSAEQVNLQLDEMGSHSNARTSEDSTIYHGAVLPEFQTPMVELLCDLMRPSLRESDFETEKKVIVEEIMMYDDQPPYGGYERAMAEYFGDHPLGQSVLGTVETVSGLTPERMRDYFSRRYSPNNMAIVAAGKVDFEQLVADAERFCGHWNMNPITRNSTAPHPRTGFHLMTKPQSAQQYILQMAPGPAAEDPRRFAARLAATILGDESGSRLYWSFIDSGRAESAVMGNYEFDGCGMLMTFLCCAPNQAQENLHELHRLQVRATKEGFRQREVDLAKRKIVSEILIASERAENRMFGVGGNWLKHRPYLPPDELAQLYSDVTLDDANQILQKFPLTGCTTLSVGPLENLSPPS